MAKQYSLQYIALDGKEGEDTPDMELIPKDVIQKHAVLPLSKDGEQVEVDYSRPTEPRIT